MIRRDKDTVLKNALPPKRRKVHNLDPAELPRETMEDLQGQLAELKQVEARIQAAGVNAPEALYNAQQAALSKCRQITADAKEEGVLRFVRQKLQDEPDSKLLLFAQCVVPRCLSSQRFLCAARSLRSALIPPAHIRRVAAAATNPCTTLSRERFGTTVLGLCSSRER